MMPHAARWRWVTEDRFPLYMTGNVINWDLMSLTIIRKIKDLRERIQ